MENFYAPGHPISPLQHGSAVSQISTPFLVNAQLNLPNYSIPNFQGSVHEYPYSKDPEESAMFLAIATSQCYEGCGHLPYEPGEIFKVFMVTQGSGLWWAKSQYRPTNAVGWIRGIDFAILDSMQKDVSLINAKMLYSAAEVASATSHLVELLEKDRFFAPLIGKAIQSVTIGAERFSRNFQKLLNNYSLKLIKEADGSLQLAAARFVKWKASEVAELITKHHMVRLSSSHEMQVRLPSTERIKCDQEEALIEEHDPDNEEPGSLPEKSMMTLAPVKDFLMNGAPFENLKTNFEVFVISFTEVKQQGAVSEEPAILPRPAIGLLAKLGIMERPLQPGKRRVRWKCRCGKMLYDDYIELRPGALDELGQRLNHLSAPRTTYSGSDQSRGTSSTSNNSFSTMMSWISSFFSNGREKFSGPCIPFHNVSTIGSSYSSREAKPQQDSLHLLLCIKDRRFSTSLHQELICGLKNDRQLFQFLQDEYLRQRGKLYSILSLRAPKVMNLVKFNLVFGASVDVRTHELDCNPAVLPVSSTSSSQQSCTCLPPPSKVEPVPDAEYRCTPIPPGYSPPLGSELLMHLFAHPECIEDETQTWMVAQFPKKLRGRLVRDLRGPVTGWGIHFKEGWNWERVSLVLLVYMVVSAVFGIAWTVARKGDMSGGFGVAAYLASAATVFLGHVAARSV